MKKLAPALLATLAIASIGITWAVTSRAQEAPAPAQETPVEPAPVAPAPVEPAPDQEAPAPVEPAKTYRVVPASPGLPVVAPPSLDTPLAEKNVIVLKTSRGDIELDLDGKAAPLHVRSFVYLAERGYFNGTKFHRHADLTGDNGYIIQGGDPYSKGEKGTPGTGGPGYEIPLEISNLKHDKLVIAAARSQDPDSAGSQFYITQAPVHFLDDQYSVFGKVISGQKAALALREGDTILKAEIAK